MTKRHLLYTGMTPQRIETIIIAGVRANASKLSSRGFVRIDYTYNNIVYRIGVDTNLGRVTQFYPKKTYISPY